MDSLCNHFFHLSNSTGEELVRHLPALDAAPPKLSIAAEPRACDIRNFHPQPIPILSHTLLHPHFIDKKCIIYLISHYLNNITDQK